MTLSVKSRVNYDYMLPIKYKINHCLIYNVVFGSPPGSRLAHFASYKYSCCSHVDECIITSHRYDKHKYAKVNMSYTVILFHFSVILKTAAKPVQISQGRIYTNTICLKFAQ